MKKLQATNYVIVIVFILLIFGLTLKNARVIVDISKMYLVDKSIEGEEINELLSNSFWKKDFFQNIQGGITKVLGKDVIGNFEYYIDNNGVVHMGKIGELWSSQFEREMIYLNEFLSMRNTPLLYVQIPDRTLIGYTEENWITSTYSYNDAIDDLLQFLTNEGVLCIDIRELIADGQFQPEKFFLKSDVHLTTEAELWVLSVILESTRNMGLSWNSEDVEKILDKSNYSVVVNDFRGNMGRNGGTLFAGIDTFERMYPKWKTSFKRYSYLKGDEEVGEFKDIVMNGFPSVGSEYWIIDYMQMTNPLYCYENLDSSSDNKILIIMDSMGLRTASYLSLLTKELWVSDPRYDLDGTLLYSLLAEHKFDAVIVLNTSEIIKTTLFHGLTNLIENLEVKINPDGGVRNGICVDKTESSWYEWEDRLCVDLSTDNITINGWAADFLKNLPLDSLWLEIDGKYYKCEYGLKSEYLIDIYGDNFAYCGYTVSIPSNLLSEGTIINVIAVGNDRSYIFNDVVLRVENIN